MGWLEMQTIGNSGSQYNAECPLRFQQDMQRMFSVGLAVQFEHSNPFSAQISAYRGRNLRFAALRFSPHSTSAPTMGQHSNRMLVTHQKEGVALVQQDGRESRVEAGDIFMIDPARPFFIETGEILTHSVYLKPDALRSLVPNISDYTARTIDGKSGTGFIFASMLDSVFSLASSLDESTADRISEALPYVFTAAISGLSVSDPGASDSRLRQVHRLRVLRYIRDHLRENEMTASSISSAVGLSTRYIYELFAGEDQPLMRTVWNMRLDRCRVELAAPSSVGRSIGEIAYYWGFNDAAHFSRSFRQRFGLSPRDYRKEATQHARDGV